MEKLQVNFVLEILGRPAQHIKDSLTALIKERISKEPGVKLISFDVKEPLPVQDSKDLFTTFSEISLEVDSLEVLFGTIFAYLPANIEITHPEKIVITNNDLNLLANRIALRMHDYDAITKKVISERDRVIKKLYEVAPHLFKKQEGEAPAPVKEKAKKKSKKKKR